MDFYIFKNTLPRRQGIEIHHNQISHIVDSFTKHTAPLKLIKQLFVDVIAHGDIMCARVSEISYNDRWVPFNDRKSTLLILFWPVEI